jgi:paraquat-inducible protein A
MALALAAAVLYVVANSVPMLGLTIVGREASTTVLGGCEQLWLDDQKLVASLVLFAVVIAPALQIAFMLAITLGARRAIVPRWVGTLLRHHPHTQTWSMIEVMLLGVLVALIKIAELATVIPGLALFTLGALVFVLTWMQTTFEPRDVWNRVEWVEHGASPPAAVERAAEATW